MSKVYHSRQSLRRQRMASLRRNARWWVMIGLGAALLGIAGTAAAVIMLSGKGALT